MHKSVRFVSLNFWKKILLFTSMLLSLAKCFQEKSCYQLRSQLPRCHCSDKSDGIALRCQLLQANFKELPRLFKYLDMEPILSLKVYCRSADYLNNGTFTNSSIRELKFICPLRRLGSNSLSVIESLDCLEMKFSSFRLVPAAVKKLKGLKTLRLISGDLTRINGDFHQMVNLEVLSLKRNKIHSISREAFAYNLKLRVVNLSFNVIKSLYPGIFRFSQNLRVLSLENNRLPHVRGLLTGHAIQKINLRDNYLRSIENLFLRYMEVTIINVGGNKPLSRLSHHTFSSKLQYLKVLIMDRCGLTELPAELLKPAPFLEIVDFRLNRITSIPEGFFYKLISLRKVELSGNRLISLENVFYENIALTSVNLSENKIQYLGNAFRYTRSLETLDLSGNSIVKLRGNDFRFCPSIKSLSLRKNCISQMDMDVFSNLKQLKVLNLDANVISSLNSTLCRLTSLVKLTMGYNNLRKLTHYDFPISSHLKSLNLTGSWLESVDGTFKELKGLSSLTLEKNSLMTLSRNSFASSSTLRHLLLSKNKWICDCRILWLRDLYANGRLNDDGSHLYCSQPKRFGGRRIIQLSAEDLTLWPDGCPPTCRCICVDDDNENFHVRVDCSNRGLVQIPSKLPEHVEELDMHNNTLTNPISFDFKGLHGLRSLNLEGNFLKELHFVLPRNIITVKLAENNITRFFANPPTSVSNWTLSKNPWACDCETLPFRKWLMSQESKITDVNETRCDPEKSPESLQDKVITYLSEADLCPSFISTYIFAAFGISSVLIVGLASRLTYSRYHYHIKVWLYSRGLTWLKKEQDQDYGKTHDAFVSSSDEDFLLVRNFIMPELEGKAPHYSLFEPRRDMKAGEFFEYEKEMEEVMKSKRVIVLLSKHYINNNFLMEIFKVAFTSSIEEKLFRLIIIIVGELPPLSEVDPSLKAAIECTQCLRFEEKLFWEMLRFAMPNKEAEQRAPLRTDDPKCVRDRTEDDVPLLQS